MVLLVLKVLVVLDNTVADVATTAATPKAINDYAVPLNLGTLQELPDGTRLSNWCAWWYNLGR